jgi:hypothetical protein
MHRQGSRITLLTGLAAVTLSMLASPAGAAFPGRNGRIVVPSNRSGNFELWTVKANGTGWQQLTDHPDLGITLPKATTRPWPGWSWTGWAASPRRATRSTSTAGGWRCSTSIVAPSPGSALFTSSLR